MLKTLIKKQLAELGATMFGKSVMGKSKKQNKKGMVALYIVLFAYLFAVFAVLFYGMSSLLFEAFAPLELDWLCFSLLGIAATGFGVIGTVFLTNSMLYNAKDNELLLSMPIKPRDIIFSRVFTLYIMDFIYEAMIILPCFAAYIVRGNASFAVIFNGIVMLLALPLFSLALSLVLGFLVALASGRMKNKSLITLVLSVGFMVAYFYVAMQMENYITMLAANGAVIGKNIKTFAYPIYALGLACTGNLLALLIFLACVLAVFGLVYFVVCRSFIKLATMKRGGKSAVYREKAYKAGGAESALLKKELSHFWASPTYMLNSSIGSVFMLIGAVFVVIERESILGMISVMPALENVLPVIICAAIGGVASMNLITAPAISLEGKNMWLLRSLPLSSWSVLKSKIALHMLVSGVPTLIFAIVCAAALPMDIAARTLLPVMSVIFNLMFAQLGLAINLKHPSFDWTNEAVPVKQGVSVLLAMLAGMGIIMFFAIVYIVLTFALNIQVPASLFMLGVMIVCCGITVRLYVWLYKRGTKIFETF